MTDKEKQKAALVELMRLDQELGLYDIEEKIENSDYYKFSGIAPDGFTLVPNEVIEMLDDFEEWKDFKYRKFEWLMEKSKANLKVKQNKENND